MQHTNRAALIYGKVRSTNAAYNDSWCSHFICLCIFRSCFIYFVLFLLSKCYFFCMCLDNWVLSVSLHGSLTKWNRFFILKPLVEVEDNLKSSHHIKDHLSYSIKATSEWYRRTGGSLVVGEVAPYFPFVALHLPTKKSILHFHVLSPLWWCPLPVYMIFALKLSNISI